MPALVRELQLVGSDVDHFGCPRCGAHDRERHIFMYLESSGLLSEMRGKSILHFAPEKCLSTRIAASEPERYVRCDLYPTSPDIQRIDMLAMEFGTGSFDILIANHVLEHVADDRRALAEIYRVLKAGGYAILQTPYSRKLHHTWEDPGIADEAARLQAYGQADHVRLYGMDIFERFASAGFNSCVRQHTELLSDTDADKFGINNQEPFFLFQRTQ
ncbi:MAG: methyltransferase domain-containing protein [Gammaproteobacteria bacterium]